MERENLGCVVTTRCVTGSVYFQLTQNRKGKRLGGLWTAEPLGKTMKPKRSFLKTRCRVLIVSRQRNDFNVKATNRPDRAGRPSADAAGRQAVPCFGPIAPPPVLSRYYGYGGSGVAAPVGHRPVRLVVAVLMCAHLMRHSMSQRHALLQVLCPQADCRAVPSDRPRPSRDRDSLPDAGSYWCRACS